MGIFESRDNRRERKKREARARLALYGLDELSDPRDEQLALEIVSGPVGAHAMDAAIAIGADDTNDILRRQLNYQDAICPCGDLSVLTVRLQPLRPDDLSMAADTRG